MKAKGVKKTAFIFLILLLILTPVIFSAGSQEAAPAAKSEGPAKGGVLRTVVHGDPPTLDVHFTGADLVWEIGWHIFEPIITLDKNWSPTPMLADYKVEDSGKRIVLNLRKNVKFHNGKIMTAEDVVASLKRWLKFSSLAKAAFKEMDAITIVDPSTVHITFKQFSSTALIVLAFHDQGPFIMPKEVIDAAGEGEVKEYIGTGPYKFVEWIPDRHIRLARFEDYSALPGGPNGYGGTKYAWADEILFIPVSDRMTRVAGMMAGDFDYSTIPADQINQVKTNPNVQVSSVSIGEMPCMVFNLKQGNLTDVRMRQAILAALNMNDIMSAAFSDPLFYDLHPSWMPRGTSWWNSAGSETYNKPDIARAQRLMKEAGYNGQEIVWVTTSTYDYMYHNAMVAVSQLEKAGFKIKLQVVDWATLGQLRVKPEAYDIFSSGLTMKVDPTMIAFMGTGWPGWYDTPRKNELVAKLKSEFDPQKRIQLWAEMSKIIYEELPAVTFGEMKSAVAYRKNVKDLDLGPCPFFWNAWLQK